MAAAAPNIPHPNPSRDARGMVLNMKSGSRTMFNTAEASRSNMGVFASPVLLRMVLTV